MFTSKDILIAKEKVLQEIDNTCPRFKNDKSAYANGWNDCRQAFFKVIDRIRSQMRKETK